jgi:hypothetical protein
LFGLEFLPLTSDHAVVTGELKIIYKNKIQYLNPGYKWTNNLIVYLVTCTAWFNQIGLNGDGGVTVGMVTEALVNAAGLNGAGRPREDSMESDCLCILEKTQWK